MKKRVFSILTALCLCLTLLPTAAFAEGNTEESSACTCETACTAESMNTDCPVCGSEDALPENCGKYAAPVNGEESVTGTSAQALTNAKITFPAPKEGKNISEAMKTASGDADSGLTLYLTGPALWTQGQRPDKLEEDATYAEGNIYLLNFTFYTQKPITEETALTCNGESVARYADYQALTEALNDYDGKQDAYLGCVLFSAEGTGDPSMGDLRDLYLLTIYAFVHVPKTLTTQDVSTAKELTAALADSSNEAVRLTKDITIDARLDIKRSVTVDLNGHVLRYDETAEPDSIFRVNSDPDSVCTLTLTDSRPQAEHEDETLPAGGLITGGKGFAHDNGAGQSYSYYGGGVYVESGASFVLAGGTIYACGVQSDADTACGGGIYSDGGAVTIKGGAIRNCVLSTGFSFGGGVFIYSLTSWASFTMTGGIIAGCSARMGGGIYTSGCTVRITGGSIENCKASEHGGGLYIYGHTNGPVSLLDAAISGCEAERGGGVALFGFAELELGENARITDCTATETDDTEAGAVEYGAAVYMDLGATYTANYPGCFLYANGGRVDGTVYVEPNYRDQWGIKTTNAIDHTDGQPTVFTGDVYCEGDIRGGSFYGPVTVLDPRGDMAYESVYDYWKFCSNLSGGSFYGPVYTECHVSGGTYYAGLTLGKDGKLSGKPLDTGGELNDETNTPDPNGKPVTVTYKDGSGEYAKQIVQTGEKAIEPDVPSRQGYQFTDWYLDDTKYDFNTAVTEDMTLTAKWTANSYTITFDTDGGSAIDPITQGYGTTIKAPTAPTKTGYTFAGWDRAIPATMPAENMTIKANWTVNQYTITFDTDGGSTVAPITQDYGTAITAPEAPTKIGYTFSGWNPEIPAIMPAENLTITAQWRYNGGSSGGSSSYPITIPGKTENGSVTVSPKNASAGSTVTITVKPDSGYVLETISVTDKNGNDLKLTDKGGGKYTFTMPASKVEIKATFMEDNSVLNFFYDVPNDAYYFEAVKWAAENGITGGVGNSLFAPNQPCTRAQIVTFLWRAAGSPVVNYRMPFTDVDEGAYYAEAVRWAASCGIVTGLTETTFGTNGVCTRAQAAAMIYRCAQAQGKGFTGAWMFHLPFTDVPEWAYESVVWCYMNGVTTGVSETSFAPGNDCTRAQIVTFLWRAFSK